MGWKMGVTLNPKIYAGRYRLRHSSGIFYFHIPVKIAENLVSRRARVTAMINVDGCNDKKYSGSVIVFRAILIYIGGTI
jgi:hypothetical protein